MDCDCHKNKDNLWPDPKDETGENILNEDDNLFDKIINRRKYDYSSDEDDDFFLEELTAKIAPKKEIKENSVSREEGNFLEELRSSEGHLLEDEDRTKEYDAQKEEQIKIKLQKLK
tara:strand:- start:569 stop:916 length:348 start_codon:yes stop_codon:yes gene_type:complete